MEKSQIKAVKQQLISVARQLAEKGLLFRGQHANLSARVSDQILLTRGGHVSQLGADDFVLLDLEGRIQEGGLESTNAEIVDMHTRVYQVRPDIGSIIHCHAPHVTAFAVAQQPMPLAYEPLLRFGHAEPTPVVPWAPRGSTASVQGIINAVDGHPSLQAVMLANHGVLAFGRDPMLAGQFLTTLDEAAELILAASLIGGAKSLPSAAFEEVQTRMRQFAGAVDSAVH